MGDTAARPPAVNRRPYLFATASRLPLLGLGDRPPVEEVTHTRPMTRQEQMHELVRISNRQTVLRHLHPRRERRAYEDAQ